MLDGYTCTECGRCRVVCPTALTGKPLDPKIFIGDVRDAVYEATPGDPGGASGRGNGARGAGAPGPHRRLDLGGHDLGLHDVRLLHDGLPGVHHPGGRQDRRDAPLPRPRQGGVPEGSPERLPRHGDQRQSVEHLGRDARRLGEGPARRDDGRGRRARRSRSSSGSAAPAPTRTAPSASRRPSSRSWTRPGSRSRSSATRRPAPATPRGAWATSTSSRCSPSRTSRRSTATRSGRSSRTARTA